MRPHPLFKDSAIPRVHSLGEFTLKALTVADLERDFAAVMESAAEIRAANPGSTWPEGLTSHDDLLDLAWHQREFESRRSFAFVIENAAGDYLGCLYVYPSLAGDRAADVVWWWRTGMPVTREVFPAVIRDWLSGPDWPSLSYNLKSG